MYECIVVGTDGSKGSASAVRHAADLAKLSGASLHLVQGCGSPIVVASLVGEIAAIDPHEVEAACQRELEPLAGELTAEGITVEVHVVAEPAPTALCHVAEAVDADLIVVGSRGMTGARRLLGSVPNSVAHHAQCSVLIVST